MSFDYDVIIIGSGPAGFSCAMQSTKFDKKVLIVEADDNHLGGTWLNKGTVPSKALREAADLIQDFHTQFGDEKGRKPFERFRMEDLLSYKKSALDSKNRKVKTDLIKNEVETARGWGEIVDEHTVTVKDSLNKTTTYTTENILIATGSRPEEPKNFNIDHSSVLDYNSILNITHIPRRLVIVGSGVISFEYATIFASLGTRITILNDSDEFLPFLDHEIRDDVFKVLKKKGIIIHTLSKVKEVKPNPLRTCMEVVFRSELEDRLQVLESDHILYVGGKIPNTDNLFDSTLNIDLNDEGYINTDHHYRTAVKNIYAAGDVTGDPTSASASFVQGRLAACSMFDIPSESPTGDIPYGIYSIPEISGIGLTEEQAHDMGIDVTVGRAYYKNLTYADINHRTDGMLKLVFKTDDLKLLGVHIFGDHATDLIHLGQSIMAQDGTIKYFIEHVLNYPTYSEAYRVAAFNGVNRVYKAGVKYKNILNNKS
ncbi:Si-specific NAD(P)(+) transhydrogenase [Rhodohalobacter barkolensis]|uniref:Soluble pyridine nucleotide transhydrogenase n=1 Tax=Rhodohalobacter barkolensis TaxID=2053187 RepID=A0A2N0VM51_9BACT|nr:Si-specific NAD(P)(+) transhydrogenase [Rhodohalobacter barkolensis]PKD45276.1 Si-specific NAD(P)(+) transhydrogenase [Rhodohalobacter barkolensis]